MVVNTNPIITVDSLQITYQEYIRDSLFSFGKLKQHCAIEDISFLESDNLKRKFSYGFNLNKRIESSMGPFNYVLSVKNIETENLYHNDSFIDCQFSILYNINY